MRKHRLVAIGDSLNQGFASGAIHFTEYSYSAIIAREMGLADQELLHPQLRSGGLPLNLWERAPRAQWAPFYRAYPNLTILGFEIRDAYDLTVGHCKSTMERATGNLIMQVLKSVKNRMALRVLNPSQLPHLNHQTQISAAKQLPADGGIENLILWMGANNALKTVTQLRLDTQGVDRAGCANILTRDEMTPAPLSPEGPLPVPSIGSGSIHSCQLNSWERHPPGWQEPGWSLALPGPTLKLTRMAALSITTACWRWRGRKKKKGEEVRRICHGKAHCIGT